MLIRHLPRLCARACGAFADERIVPATKAGECVIDERARPFLVHAASRWKP